MSIQVVNELVIKFPFRQKREVKISRRQDCILIHRKGKRKPSLYSVSITQYPEENRRRIQGLKTPPLMQNLGVKTPVSGFF